MTKEEADAELARQLETRENKYRKRFGDKWDNLTDNQKIALLSYGYNTGDNNIVNGKIAKYLDEGNLAKVRDSLSINTFKGVYHKGLDARRKRERELFDS
jgi:GH24 family phage-related lysozyme (muramidase)